MQKQLNQENIDEKLMNELQGNITEYHQLITEYLPNFAKKAKTHLLLHVVSFEPYYISQKDNFNISKC